MKTGLWWPVERLECAEMQAPGGRARGGQNGAS